MGAKAKRAHEQDEAIYRFRLYVAGDSPNSAQARSNLEKLCKQYLKDRYHIELIDVMEEPGRALKDGVLVTPTLVRVRPVGRSAKVIGNLSEQSRVLAALDVTERHA